jgi:anti-sigma B factor antagonist
VQARPITPQDNDSSWQGGFLLAEESVPWGQLLKASGELDLAATPALRGWLTSAVAADARRVVLDFTEVTFIDSLALAAVVAAKRRLGADARLAVVATNPYVLLILEAGGLDSVFEVFRTREDAVEFVLG